MPDLEALDRRAFLRGMMVTSTGLVVPKPVRVAVAAAIGDPQVYHLKHLHDDPLYQAAILDYERNIIAFVKRLEPFFL